MWRGVDKTEMNGCGKWRLGRRGRNVAGRGNKGIGIWLGVNRRKGKEYAREMEGMEGKRLGKE